MLKRTLWYICVHLRNHLERLLWEGYPLPPDEWILMIIVPGLNGKIWKRTNKQISTCQSNLPMAWWSFSWRSRNSGFGRRLNIAPANSDFNFLIHWNNFILHVFICLYMAPEVFLPSCQFFCQARYFKYIDVSSNFSAFPVSNLDATQNFADAPHFQQYLRTNLVLQIVKCAVSPLFVI